MPYMYWERVTLAADLVSPTVSVLTLTVTTPAQEKWSLLQGARLGETKFNIECLY